MRGTHNVRIACAGIIGIIPAYAGNTYRMCRSYTVPRDHPRVCGEHGQRYELRYAVQGSSPRMRGTPSWRFGLPCRVWDHPRVCGEHITPNPFANAVLGSSPRMRGTRALRVRILNPHGIIPAYAGNTRPAPCRGSPDWDHPRVCGEHYYPVTIPEDALGSSPRMRGTRLECRRFRLSEGIIPAYAGNTYCLR